MMICRLTLTSCPSKPQPESLHCSCGRVRLPCLLMVACDEGEKKLVFGAVPGPRDESCRFRWLWGDMGDRTCLSCPFITTWAAVFWPGTDVTQVSTCVRSLLRRECHASVPCGGHPVLWPPTEASPQRHTFQRAAPTGLASRLH